MPRFRSPRAQAEHVVSKKIVLGLSRHDHKDDGQIHGLGTARSYEQALKGTADYIRKLKLGDLQHVSKEIALQYLTDRSIFVSQKTLDLDRQALQVKLGERLEVIRSEKQTFLSSRSYTPAQVERITSAQSEHNSLATQIVYDTGIRAHELLTIRPVNDRQASTHRVWSKDRFAGRQGEKYTVEGKGGLVREILVSRKLTTQLEATRLKEPQEIIDRGIKYIQHFEIAGGQAWSQSFSSASTRELGFSNGGHGLRHAYVQQRMEELQSSGMRYEHAKAVVAQEVGHFDPDTTEAYLR